MKELRITSVWRAYTTIEVDDNFEVPKNLSGWPPEFLEQIDTLGAELVDYWVVSRPSPG